MATPLLLPYRDPSTHEAISNLIRRHSDNSRDIRDATLEGLDLSFAREILDLGCGFGFMTEGVLPRVSPEARFTGVDACGSNKKAFLRKMESSGHVGRFFCKKLDTKLPFSSRSFDLVIASFSLYFFAEIIPEVARVLKNRGMFLVVTHNEKSFLGLLRAVGISPERSVLLALLRNFSAGNGVVQLTSVFDNVTKRDYRNHLEFRADDLDDFREYLRFKLPHMIPDVADDLEASQQLVEKGCAYLVEQGRLIVEKDDAVFVCRSSR